MTKKEFAKKMTKHEQAFDNLWKKIIIDTNDFLKDNGNHYYFQTVNISTVDRFIDSLCLSGAWISDRLNGFDGTPDFGSYKKSLTKKIRKGLGYNI